MRIPESLPGAFQVPVLCTDPAGPYHRLPGFVPFDQYRDARTFTGPGPLIAHPPCAQWGRLRAFSNADPAAKALAIHTVNLIRRHGGILEHPAHSTLWQECRLPSPSVGHRDPLSYTLDVSLRWWGFPAEKRTWLWIHGIQVRDLPDLPFPMEPVRQVIEPNRHDRHLPRLPKSQRHITPDALALWLQQAVRNIAAVNH